MPEPLDNPGYAPQMPQVCAVTQGGAFAEEAVARENLVVKLPTGCDLEAAAGLPVAFGTAYLALRDRADLQPGGAVQRGSAASRGTAWRQTLQGGICTWPGVGVGRHVPIGAPNVLPHEPCRLVREGDAALRRGCLLSVCSRGLL